MDGDFDGDMLGSLVDGDRDGDTEGGVTLGLCSRSLVNKILSFLSRCVTGFIHNFSGLASC